MTKKKTGLMALTKEDLVKKINDLQNVINNPPQTKINPSSPSTSTSSTSIESDDASAPSNPASFSNVSTDPILKSILDRVSSLEGKVTRLETENTSLRYQVKVLHRHLEEIDDDLIECEKDVTRIDQYTRRWNVEIQNIPDDVDQDHLKPAIAHALQQMNVNINEDAFEAIHRLKKAKKSKGPAPVIVRFRKRDDAFETLKKKKDSKKIENNTFGPSMRTKIFIHENLGPRAKRIFDFCLKMQKEGKIFKVWTIKGVTNILFDNDRNEKPTQVFHYEELWDLFPSDD